MEKRLPKYHETFIPILKILEGGQVMSTNEMRKSVYDKFYSDLPSELLEQKTRSGYPLILNRIGWGKAYLKQAEMIHQPARALVQITDKGREVLKKNTLTLKELLHDNDFLANRKIVKEDKSIEDINENDSPEDMVENGINSLENQVKNDLLRKLRTVDPYYFEVIVGKLFSGMGFGDFTVTVKSGDGGIDGIINQDKLGLEKIFIQAKRYAENNKIREPLIREFIGAMSRGTKKGIFVTTSSFDESAIIKARDADHIIRLIDGRELVDLMYKHGVGVQAKNTYEIKQIDEDFFEEE